MLGPTSEHRCHRKRRSMTTDPDDKPKGVDLERATRLIEALERDLAKVHEGSVDVETLRSEVEQLRSALKSPSVEHGEVHERLHGIRALLHQAEDELVGDTLEVSDYLARIGRMLGM
jgi:DNA repair exonuclease SbcCD ATPase subunit